MGGPQQLLCWGNGGATRPREGGVARHRVEQPGFRSRPCCARPRPYGTPANEWNLANRDGRSEDDSADDRTGERASETENVTRNSVGDLFRTQDIRGQEGSNVSKPHPNTNSKLGGRIPRGMASLEAYVAQGRAFAARLYPGREYAAPQPSRDHNG